ncbi:MAG: Uncharacterised protein [Synechococcus sp. MIT S9220]|nr:MAG: Uncharacterised protein [Synechococcus sp. MIT S9220]
MGIGQTGCFEQLIMARWSAETNRLGNAAGEHRCALGHEGDLLPEFARFHLRQVVPIQLDLS